MLPYSLDWGDSIWAKIVATNLVGNSEESDEGNGAVILTNPDAPVSLANDNTSTSASQITLTWSDGASNGGAPIIDYRVLYANEGSGSFVVLASGVSGTTHTSTSLTPGSKYTFKVESRNSFGFSTAYSNEVTIL